MRAALIGRTCASAGPTRAATAACCPTLGTSSKKRASSPARSRPALSATTTLSATAVRPCWLAAIAGPASPSYSRLHRISPVSVSYQVDGKFKGLLRVQASASASRCRTATTTARPAPTRTPRRTPPAAPPCRSAAMAAMGRDCDACVLVCERWPCAGEVAEHTVRQDSPSCPKKCDSNATAPHNVFADDKYAPQPHRVHSRADRAVKGTRCSMRHGSECAVQCSALHDAVRGTGWRAKVHLHRRRGLDVRGRGVDPGVTVRQCDTIVACNTHGTRWRSGRRAACSDRLRRSEPTCGATRSRRLV